MRSWARVTSVAPGKLGSGSSRAPEAAGSASAAASARSGRAARILGLTAVEPTGPVRLPEHLAGVLVHDDLALDSLQRVVDRLGVHLELHRHVLVRGTLEVETKRLCLQLRQSRAEAEDEALELLGRDHLHRR